MAIIYHNLFRLLKLEYHTDNKMILLNIILLQINFNLK